MRKLLLILPMLLLGYLGFSQTYNPALHAPSPKSLGISTAAPTDARSYYYDATNFVYRPYNSTSEVLSYLNNSTKRSGKFPIYITISGSIRIYAFLNGTADGNLVPIDAVDKLAISDTTVFSRPGKPEVLTNKTISGTNNVFSNIQQAAIIGLFDSLLKKASIDTLLSVSTIRLGPGLVSAQNELGEDSILVDTADGIFGPMKLKTDTANLSYRIDTTASNINARVNNKAPLTNILFSSLGQNGATTGQVPKWNGSGWVPDTDNSGSGGLSGNLGSGFRIYYPPSTGAKTVTATSPLVWDSATTNQLNLSILAASAAQNGYLTSTDWSTFNNKVATTRSISTTSPLSGGGDLSANRTISIADAAADGTTKGASTYNANDFNATTGVISLDYTNGQAASTSNKGFLTNTDWNTFNNKQATVTELDDALGFSSNVLSTNTALQALTDGATITMTTANGINGRVTLGGNRTLAIPSPQGGKFYSIKVIQDVTGGRTLTLPGGGTAILRTAAGDSSVITGLYDNTNSSWTWWTDYNNQPYTNGSGIGLTGNSFSNNLTTGVSGGQTIIGGTASNDQLIIKPNSSGGSDPFVGIKFQTPGGSPVTAMDIFNNGVVRPKSIADSIFVFSTSTGANEGRTGNPATLYEFTGSSTFTLTIPNSVSVNGWTFDVFNHGTASLDVSVSGGSNLIYQSAGDTNTISIPIGECRKFTWSASTGRYLVRLN